MKYAHYFKSGKNHQLVISSSPRPVGDTHVLTSKKEVKELAKQLNATPYNF